MGFRFSRWRVPLGYGAGAVVVLLARPGGWPLIVGSAVALAGELVRVWASGHIRKTAELATGGPYAHTRNPLYVGSLLLALGLAVAASSPWVVAIVAAYFALVYPPVIREEAAFLRDRFGDAYAAWAREVPAFVPRVAPAGPRASRFSWKRVRANREWRTALALPAVVALLWARGAWLP